MACRLFGGTKKSSPFPTAFPNKKKHICIIWYWLDGIGDFTFSVRDEVILLVWAEGFRISLDGINFMRRVATYEQK